MPPAACVGFPPVLVAGDRLVLNDAARSRLFVSGMVWSPGELAELSRDEMTRVVRESASPRRPSSGARSRPAPVGGDAVGARRHGEREGDAGTWKSPSHFSQKAHHAAPLSISAAAAIRSRIASCDPP